MEGEEERGRQVREERDCFSHNRVHHGSSKLLKFAVIFRLSPSPKPPFSMLSPSPNPPFSPDSSSQHCTTCPIYIYIYIYHIPIYIGIYKYRDPKSYVYG